MTAKAEVLAKVSVDTGLMSLDKTFDYKIPEELKGILRVGHTVSVPFGGTKKDGIVIGISNEKSEYKLKSILKITNENPVVGEKEIHLAAYMQKMYVASFHECLKLMCPPGTFSKEDIAVRITEAAKTAEVHSVNQERILAYLYEAGGEASLESLKAVFGRETLGSVKALLEKGFIEKEAVSVKTVGELKRKYVRLLKPESEFSKILGSRAVSQMKAAKALLCGPLSLSELCEMDKITSGAVKALSEKGIAEIYDVSKRRNPFLGKSVKKTEKLAPTKEQEAVLEVLKDAVESEKSDTFLLHGVTGSGKTEVFMQTIERVLEKGKTAIVLVPEISLTPQMTDRFIGRFGEKIAILHSVLSRGERLDEWKRIKNGEAKVVVGARSAVFAPLSDIGIIIVDEEHENTYKSEQSPRYDAREIAKERCRMNKAPLLLASATPDIASYYKAMRGEYKMLKMTKRYNEAKLPDVKISDMRKELASGNRSMISSQLRDEIAKNIESGEQTVLFLNRRGFSTFVSCRDCGYVVSCPECSIALTYHKTEESLQCHYCGYKTRVIKTCPECKGSHVRYFGAGTQKLEEEIKKTFPSASTIRMDVDTTSRKGSHERILKTFSEEKIDILLGTQMVSKGLDFPDISLVGVMAADMSLNIDDYRASERTFDLITQVCGRAGRGVKEGRAVIQTYTPDNDVIKMARTQNYEAFYENEIAYREMFLYPPFSDIVSFVFSSEDNSLAEKACRESEKMAEEILKGIKFSKYSSMPAPLSRIKGRYRWRYWIKISADDNVRMLLKDIYLGHRDKNVRLSLEINPGSML
ncbi:MAG: primosomal protein N' [Clostridia bacterium]|nr:primosomal protein N' [Clostridia bacterium]